MQIPTYSDGKFRLFNIKDAGESYPKDILVDTEIEIWFNEPGVGDTLKSELKQNDIEVTTKITIPQYRNIKSGQVVEIDGTYHRIYNTYHSQNKDGFLETNLTLERYKNE